jgi:hypothetical protein
LQQADTNSPFGLKQNALYQPNEEAILSQSDLLES